MARLFIARYDVSSIDFTASDPDNNIWRISGKVIDMTGSYTASNVTTEDKIVMRGYHVDGYMVYDRYRVKTITSVSGSTLTIDAEYEVPYMPNETYVGDPMPQIFGNTPITGSFPIGSDLAYKDFIRMPSTYQHLIDPDYAAGMSNLNFEQISNGELIEVTGSNAPTIINYRPRLASVFGEYPIVRLFITDDDGNRYESMQNAKFIIVDDLVDSISFDLGENVSGYVLIQ